MSMLKNSRRAIATFILAVLTASGVEAQEMRWTRIGPFGGGFYSGFESLAIDTGGTIYASTAFRHDVVRSTDGARTWVLIDSVQAFDLVATGADTLFARLHFGPFARSTDAGRTWRAYGNAPDSWLPLPDGSIVATEASPGSTQVIGYDANGVRRSGGWSVPFRMGLVGRANGGDLIARAADTMLLSTNGGRSWTAGTTGIAAGSSTIYFGMAPDGDLIMVDDSSRAYRSTDRGRSWSFRGRPASGGVAGVAATLDAVGDIYTSVGRVTYRSTDQGATWDSVAQRSFVAIMPLGNDIVGAEERGIVLRSSDHGETWFGVKIGLPGPAITSVLAPTDTAVVARADLDRFRWSAANDDWMNVSVPFGPTAVRAGGERLIAYSERTHLLHTSTDVGATWTVSDTTGPVGSRPLLGTDRTGAIILAGVRTFRTTDLGASWLPLDTSAGGRVYGSIQRDSTGRLLSFHQRALVTFDEPAGRWIPLPTGPPLPNGATSLLTMPDGTIIVGTWSEGIHRSTNNGLTWDVVAAPDSSLERIAVDGAGNLVAIAGSYVLYLSRDKGTTWRSISRSLPMQVLTYDVAPSGRVYVGTAVGVYRSDESVLAVRTDDARVRCVAALAPNPFDSHATLMLELERAGNAAVTLVASTGETIRTLHDGALDAGTHAITLSSEGLAAGAYFVRIVFDGHVESLPVYIR
jgi:hypothetical protein